MQHWLQTVIPRILYWFRTVGLCIPYHKDVGNLRIVTFFCSPKHLSLCIYEIRQIRPFQDKFFIIELLVHNISDPGQHQCYIRTRTDWQPDICFCRIRSQSRINDNSLDTFGTKICHGAATACRTGVRRICSPQHQRLDWRIFRIVDFQRIGVCNTRIHTAIHHCIGKDTGQIALCAARLKPVWSSENITETGNTPDLRVTAAACRTEYGFCSIFLFGLYQFMSNNVQCFVP